MLKGVCSWDIFPFSHCQWHFGNTHHLSAPISMCIWICHVQHDNSHSTHTHTNTCTHTNPKQRCNSGASVVSLCFSDNKRVLGSFFISNLRALHWKCHEIDPQARPLLWYGITCREHQLLNLMFNAAFYCCSFRKKVGKWNMWVVENWNALHMHAFAYCMQKYIQTRTHKHAHKHTHTHTVREHTNAQGSPVGRRIMEEDCVNPICA